MQQQLNSVLANQSSQEQKVNTIENNLIKLSSNMSELKEEFTKNGERTAPSPLDGTLTSNTQMAPTWAERVAARVQHGDQARGPSTNQRPASAGPQHEADLMLLVADSIGHNMHINEIEQATKMKNSY